MTSKKRLSFICYGITFLVFLLILFWGMSGSTTGNGMGYSVLSFYLIMPITSFVISLILGLKNAYLKWLYPVLFGVFGNIIPSIVFVGSQDTISLFFSFVPEKGELNKAIETDKNALKEFLSLDLIAKLTGLDISTIKKLER